MKHLLAFSALLSGCALPSPVSEDVSSRDISVTFRVENVGFGAVATAELQMPFENLRLSGGDRLVVTTASGQTALADTKGADGKVVYQSSLGEVSGNVTLDLARKRDESSLGHSILLPPPFTLTASPLDPSQPISFTWDGVDKGYATIASIEGECVKPITRPLVQDVGAYGFSWSELEKTSSTNCPLTITVRRTTQVQNDPMFEDQPTGWFQGSAEQRRSVTISP